MDEKNEKKKKFLWGNKYININEVCALPLPLAAHDPLRRPYSLYCGFFFDPGDLYPSLICPRAYCPFLLRGSTWIGRFFSSALVSRKFLSFEMTHTDRGNGGKARSRTTDWFGKRAVRTDAGRLLWRWRPKGCGVWRGVNSGARGRGPRWALGPTLLCVVSLPFLCGLFCDRARWGIGRC